MQDKELLPIVYPLEVKQAIRLLEGKVSSPASSIPIKRVLIVIQK